MQKSLVREFSWEVQEFDDCVVYDYFTNVPRTRRNTRSRSRVPMSMRQFFEFLVTSEAFRTLVINNLLELPRRFGNQYKIRFPATSYDTMAFTAAGMAVKPTRFQNEIEDTDTFKEHLAKCVRGTGQGSKKQHLPAISFDSLSGNVIVSPCPEPNVLNNHAAHIGEFMKYGSVRAVHGFWRTVGETALERMAGSPSRKFTLNTDGHDVSWLHAKFTFDKKKHRKTPRSKI